MSQEFAAGDVSELAWALRIEAAAVTAALNAMAAEGMIERVDRPGGDANRRPWFKVVARLRDDRSLLRLSAEEERCWWRLLAACADEGVGDVVDAGGCGVRIVRWFDHQPRITDADRARRTRERNARPDGDRTATGRRARQGRTTTALEVEGEVEEEREEEKKKGATKPRRRACALPASWAPSPAHIDLAESRGLNADEQATIMRDWAASNGTTKRDWDATFRNWLRRARPGRGGTQRSLNGELLAKMLREGDE